MQTTDLQLYTIMPLDIAHFDEICEDIKAQYESGVATCALFSMTLVPEGDPPTDKAALFGERYALFRAKLSAWGIPNGVLIQASMGHGWKLGELFPYRQYVQLTDGEKTYTVCPSDVGFHAYLRSVGETIARYSPDHIMLDDDFRLMFRAGGGCACPLHLESFAGLFGARMTREELLETVKGCDERSQNAARCFIQSQKDSLLKAVRVLRDAIDSVDPTIPGSFCTVGSSVEFGAEIAHIMAGKGNPTVLRINNANYTPVGAKYFSKSFLKCAASVAKLKGRVDVVLAETDTCPQNRYSTSARSLHTHFTGSIIEGAAGAKHWITRLASHEPESGVAYRRILGRYRGFYRTLASLVPTLHHRGFCIPVGKEASFPLGGAWVQSQDGEDEWSKCVLERLGLPLYFSPDEGGVVCLEGERDAVFSDDEVLKRLQGNMMLSSDSAARLSARGFGEYLGVEIGEWQGKTPTNELFAKKNAKCNVQPKLRAIYPKSEDVKVLSTVANSKDRVNYEPLFPGCVVYENSFGGRIVTFAGSPQANFNISEAFSFLNLSRKQQLVEILDASGELPVYYPGDEDVYFRAADMDDGGLFCAIFNLSSDPIEKTELVVKKEIVCIKRIAPDGAYQSVAFEKIGVGRIRLDCLCDHLEPVVLLLY